MFEKSLDVIIMAKSCYYTDFERKISFVETSFRGGAGAVLKGRGWSQELEILVVNTRNLQNGVDRDYRLMKER